MLFNSNSNFQEMKNNLILTALGLENEDVEDFVNLREEVRRGTGQ